MTKLQRNNNKRLNLLGFDGGGSRGVMEAMILDDLMRLVTKMTKDPARFKNLPELIRGRNKCTKRRNSGNASDEELNLGYSTKRQYTDVFSVY